MREHLLTLLLLVIDAAALAVLLSTAKGRRAMMDMLSGQGVILWPPRAVIASLKRSADPRTWEKAYEDHYRG